ncbi:HAD-IIB family hydrolase [Aestuariirhabdus sp. Z084]|uniref:HAD-IIB family hydrolase n=1 Tax=Aestuariirhabdus haliotis TaxID=2918751 RepID=UPI00201B381C|nr:HAD-IIB family hydrolase [Aestuariirhabdus haliotis]MCL6417242.1 HAD-IIB family hydrolase [Aestuariirhabdus haliotis]MCL6421193.1 HAD-IIB family hydrolase [Aestuariirhabdus haliotis]
MGTERSLSVLIFTDLDGCLLDHDGYSYAASAVTLEALRNNVPIIINSSKTFSEIEQLVVELGLNTPFIFENGSAIAFPQNWNPSLPASTYPYKNWMILSLARPRELLLHRLNQLASGYRFQGFAELSLASLMELTGLTEAAALQAKQRLFTEPLYWQDSESHLAAIARELEPDGLRIIRGGRFVHVMDSVDKAIAMRTLQIMLEQNNGATYQTVALGDSDNDRRMLASADYACVVRKSDGTYLDLGSHSKTLRSDSAGSAGWNECITALIQQGVINSGDYHG